LLFPLLLFGLVLRDEPVFSYSESRIGELAFRSGASIKLTFITANGYITQKMHVGWERELFAWMLSYCTEDGLFSSGAWLGLICRVFSVFLI